MQPMQPMQPAGTQKKSNTVLIIVIVGVVFFLIMIAGVMVALAGAGVAGYMSHKSAPRAAVSAPVASPSAR